MAKANKQTRTNAENPRIKTKPTTNERLAKMFGASIKQMVSTFKPVPEGKRPRPQASSIPGRMTCIFDSRVRSKARSDEVEFVPEADEVEFVPEACDDAL